MLHKHITRLQELMLTTPDLAVPVSYFGEHLATNPALQRASQAAISPRLVAILQSVVTRHYGQVMPIGLPAFLHAAAYRFWHGDCQVGRDSAHLIYFEDVDVGILAIARLHAPGEPDILSFSVVRRGRGPAS